MVQELTPFELERKKRIEENTRRLAELGVLQAARDLAAVCKPPVQQRNAIPRPRVPRPKAQRRQQPMRASRRVSGQCPEYNGYASSDEEGGGRGSCLEYTPLKDLLAGSDAPTGQAPVAPEAAATWQLARCNSAGRGSFYDSNAGITCHFCRQKKLCGEEGCPRCSTRNTEAECIGKTACGRCAGATGRFCRACLLLRYGQNLEEVRAQMAAGSWLCPHCYEEEHPEAGWICNSSICMKRRGYKPTGIAIYEAQQRGFPSVAHWLQAQLTAPGVGGTSSAAAAQEQQQEEEEVEVPAVASAAAAAGSTPEPATPHRAAKPSGPSSAAAATGDKVADAEPVLATTTPSKKQAAGKSVVGETDSQLGGGGASQEVVLPGTPVLADVSNTGHRPGALKRTHHGPNSSIGSGAAAGEEYVDVPLATRLATRGGGLSSSSRGGGGEEDVPLGKRLTRASSSGGGRSAATAAALKAAAAVPAPAALKAVAAGRGAKRLRGAAALKENRQLA